MSELSKGQGGWAEADSSLKKGGNADYPRLQYVRDLMTIWIMLVLQYEWDSMPISAWKAWHGGLHASHVIPHKAEGGTM